MLLPYFEWMRDQAVYGSSPYIGPVVNLIHLLSMVVFMGALLLVDLRLMGFGVTTQSVSKLARDARPWLIGGILGIILTGIPQTMERATDQYNTSTFWLKMYLILFGLIWTFVIRARAVRADEPRGGWPKIVAIVSILVWTSVASLARLIMLLPGNTFEFIVGS